jgi:hypothetical protein
MPETPEGGPFDVLVYGATAGGVIASIAAATAGARVILVEPGQHVGGMVASGLGWTDRGEEMVIGGLAGTFYDRVGAHYGVDPWSIRGPEPHVAERIFRSWLDEAGVAIEFGSTLVAVDRDGTAIQGIVTGRGEVIGARVFIDASYEGDLLAKANVSYAVGRESVSLHGERWAGWQPIRPDQHNFQVAISPFAGDDHGALLPFIHDQPMVAEGKGDGGVQSYCYRLCLTDQAANRVPFPRPDDYDPRRYELLRRYLVAVGLELRADRLLSLRGRLPNDKCDSNSIGPFSTNLPDGSSWAYPQASDQQRRGIWERHLHYTQGLLYFLANDPSVPLSIRTDMQQWGLCADEFTDSGHWPHQLYVRDARRMCGEYLLTQHDLEHARDQYDAIGMGSYNIDIREVQRTWVEVPRYPRMVPEVFNEGYLSVPVPPYPIPYRALLPRYDECVNLVVPVCLSASHVAFASVRMEPQFMILGHAAGLAAASAAVRGVAVHHVDIADLQRRLAAQGQVLARA